MVINIVEKSNLNKKFKFFDEIKNKTKNITTNRGINRTIIASQGRYQLFKINKLIIIIERTTMKNVINNYMKCDKIPLLWRKFLLKIANNRDYVYKYCNRPFNIFPRHCREWYLYNNTGEDDIRMLNDEMNNYGAYS